MMSNENNIQPNSQSLWIYHPLVDLLVGCGAWSLPLLLLANPFGKTNLQTLALVFYSLSLVFNYPHYMATIYRAYATKEEFSKYRFFTIYLTIALVILGVFAHSSHKILALIFTTYLTWSPWHYMGQNFGLFMMFSRRSGLEVRQFDRNAIYLSFLASYLMIFFSFHTGPSTDPYILSLNIPPVIGKSANMTLLVMFILTGTYGLFNLIGQVGLKRLICPLVIFSTEFLWFVLPTLLQTTNFIKSVPQIRYSTGVLAIMHSIQYLWITSFFAKKEAIISNNNWRLLPYLITLIVGGIALFVPGPWLISYLFTYDFTTSFLVFTSLINIHHFLLDGAIWKLRDSRIASLLIKTQTNLSDSVSKVAQVFRSTSIWFTSTTLLARTSRVLITIILLIFASVDQTRFYLALKEGNLSHLSYAARLNPNDATVKTRLALASANKTNLTNTILELRSALKLNPYDPEIQNRLAQILIENQMFDEAYTHYQQMQSYISLDANSLINFGILAKQLHHEDEAIICWQKAISITPNQLNLYIYLADSFFQKRDYIKAIFYYENFLSLSANQPLEQRPTPKELVPIVLNLADCYTHTATPEHALEYCEKAITIAEQSKDKSLISFVFIKLGEIYFGFEDLDNAISAYQKALKLDIEVKDNKTLAADWVGYSKILIKANIAESTKLALASLLKAEELLKDLPDARQELAETIKTRESLEKNTGLEAAKIQKDLDSYVEKALNLKP